MFRKAFAEIKVTDRNIEEWVRFTRGIPLTKEFNKFGIKTFLERLRRVAMSYPEFQVQSINEQQNGTRVTGNGEI